MDSNTPPTDPPLDDRIVPWLQLQKELSELHARLEYFRLMLKLSALRSSS